MFNTYLSNNIVNDDELDKLINQVTAIDYSRFYRGTVVENYDPLNIGRIKVRIPQIYGINSKSKQFVSTASIPWATPGALPMGNDSGCYLVPNIGDIVYVTFENSDSSLPIYFGGILTNRGNFDKSISSYKINNNDSYISPNDDISQDIKNGTERVIYKSLKGATIIIDDYDGGESLKIIDQSGQSIIMENTSGESLDRRGNSLGKNIQSQIVLTNNSGDSIRIKKGSIVIKSPNVIIESDNFKHVTSYEDEERLADLIIGE